LSRSPRGPASLSGRLRHDTEIDPTAPAAVGDWVALELIGATGLGGRALPDPARVRRTQVIRRSPGDAGCLAVLAANVDVVFVVTSVNAEFNVRRLERYVTVAWESGATPVILLSKSDLADDIEGYRITTAATAPGVDVIAVSVVTGEGLEAVRGHLGVGRTVVFTGSSGVGKSSIVNALAGEPLLDTGGIRLDDARGRHTTTRRQLIRLADGLLIDTPGLRELGILDGDGLSTAFEDIEKAATGCRFGDCQHRSEPGCAVRAALADGSLTLDRLEAYRKLGASRAGHARHQRPPAGRSARSGRRSTAASTHMRVKYGPTDDRGGQLTLAASTLIGTTPASSAIGTANAHDQGGTGTRRSPARVDWAGRPGDRRDGVAVAPGLSRRGRDGRLARTRGESSTATRSGCIRGFAAAASAGGSRWLEAGRGILRDGSGGP
jgi:ribosome biogenesis GTPase